MTHVQVTLAAGLCLAIAAPASAQSLGVLQSAETMDRSSFKLMLAPMMVFGKDGADDTFGAVVRGGYGFTERFDAEAKLGFFEHSTVVGADGEFWLMKDQEKDAGIDISLAVGLHKSFGKDNALDVMGFELTPLVSGHLGTSVELYGALDVSFESISDAPKGVDDSFTSVHIVPGIEYRLSDQADLVGEIGVAVNDESSTYAAAGLAFYFR